MASDLSRMKNPLMADALLYFIHIPKTAGTTFRLILESKFSPSEFEMGELLEFGKGLPQIPPVLESKKCRLFISHYNLLLNTTLSRPVVYITMLRNPIERSLSQYYFNLHHIPLRLAENKPLDHDLKFIHQHPLLENYLNSDALAMKASMSNLHIRGLLGLNHVDIDHLPEDELFGMAWEKLQQMPFFGIAERFQDSLDLLNYTFTWQPVSHFESVNITPNRPPRTTHSPKIIERLHELNRIDLRLYDAAVALFAQRHQAMVSFLLKEHWLKMWQSALPETAELNLSAQAAQSHFFDGWYVLEEHPQEGQWRWMGSYGSLYFKIPSAVPVTLEIQTKYVISPDIFACLNIQVDGITVAYTLTENLIIIPMPQRDDNLRFVELHAPCAVSPQELSGSSDQRPLSLALSRIRLSPINR